MLSSVAGWATKRYDIAWQRNMADRVIVLGFVLAGITLMLILYPPGAQCHCHCQTVAGRHLLQDASPPPVAPSPAAPSRTAPSLDAPPYNPTDKPVAILAAAIFVVAFAYIGEVYNPVVVFACGCFAGLSEERHRNTAAITFRTLLGVVASALTIYGMVSYAQQAGVSWVLIMGLVFACIIGIAGFIACMISRVVTAVAAPVH